MKFLFSLIFFTFSLSAGIKGYFQKFEVSDIASHAMKNIDCVYMIESDPSSDQYKKSESLLSSFGITPFHFVGIDGMTLTFDDLNALGVKYVPGMEGSFPSMSFLTLDLTPIPNYVTMFGQTYFGRAMTRKKIGNALSHLSILQHAKKNSLETIWVLEDPIEIYRDPTFLSSLVERLDERVGRENWDLLYTDRDLKDENGEYLICEGFSPRPNFRPEKIERFFEKVEIDHEFRKVGARFGSTSIIFNKNGIEKVLNFLTTHQLFLPFDLELSLPNTIQIYTVIDDVVGNSIYSKR